MRKNTELYNNLRNLIRNIFWEEWDPIGLRQLDQDWNKGEYDVYANSILQILIGDKATEKQIFDMLDRYVEYINGEKNDVVSNRSKIVAKKLINLQPTIQKYAKLAIEEQKKYPIEDVNRIQKINDELEEYLRMAEENEKDK